RDGAVDGNDHCLVLPLDQPRRPAVQPVIGLFVLVTVDEGLAEETELLVDAVAEAGHVERGQGVEETGGEAYESAVAEGRVGLERLQLLKIVAELGEHRPVLMVDSEVLEVVAKRAANQELHREV